MATYRIYTSGPVIEGKGTLKDGMARVERDGPPMGDLVKKGWTYEWRHNPDGSATYRWRNSKGRIQPRYSVTVVQIPWLTVVKGDK